MNTAASAPTFQKPLNYWLRSKAYDLSLFQLSVFIGFISLLPYYRWGISAAFLLYVVQSFLAGGPHVYLTMVTLASQEARKKLNLRAVGLTFAISIILAAGVVFFRGTEISDFLISVTFFLAAWHSYRQHYGLSKIYDYVLSRRSGDLTLSQDMKPMYVFYGLAMNFVIVYAFSIPHVPYIIARGWQIDLWYPHLPIIAIQAYLAVTALVGAWAFKKTIYDRHVNKKFLPIPQLLIMGTTMIASAVLYFLLPSDAYMLMWIIPTLGHNIQYFGFVWLFEKKRIEIIESENGKIEGTLKLVKNSQ